MAVLVFGARLAQPPSSLLLKGNKEIRFSRCMGEHFSISINVSCNLASAACLPCLHPTPPAPLPLPVPHSPPFSEYSGHANIQKKILSLAVFALLVFACLLLCCVAIWWGVPRGLLAGRVQLMVILCFCLRDGAAKGGEKAASEVRLWYGIDGGRSVTMTVERVLVLGVLEYWYGKRETGILLR